MAKQENLGSWLRVTNFLHMVTSSYSLTGASVNTLHGSLYSVS